MFLYAFRCSNAISPIYMYVYISITILNIRMSNLIGSYIVERKPLSPKDSPTKYISGMFAKYGFVDNNIQMRFSNNW